MASARHAQETGIQQSSAFLPESFDWPNTLSTPSFWPTTLVIIFSLLVLEQVVYRKKKAHLPGPKWTIPIIGKFADSLNPTMEAYHKTWSEPMHAVSVFNIFIVMVSDNTLVRKIFNSPTHAEPCLVASAKQVLVPTNWVFLTGKVHAEYRKGLNVLFTRRALAIYSRMQEAIRRKHFKQWLDLSGGPQPMMPRFRDLNMDTSIHVFCGDYIPDEAVDEISAKYLCITRALELVNFPLALPGTKVYKAIQARKRTMIHLEGAIKASRENMKTGAEATCMIDEWNQALLQEPNGYDKYSTYDQALVVLSFIFASQDAMSSSLTHGFQFLADYPEMLAKVREEQERVRGGNYENDVTLDQIDQMTYTRAFVKEILRYRPPVIMVPYLAKRNMQITDDYTVPKGAIVIPSLWNSTHDPEVYAEPDTFMPERWVPGGVSEKSDPKNYLVFGAGPHKCIGQEYVYMHMASVLGSAAATMNIEHQRTKDSDVLKIIPTIFPKDDVLLKFTTRQ